MKVFKQVKTVEDIVAAWLLDNGYDGLYNDACGCEVGDLMPCSEPGVNCEAGFLMECKCGGGCDFHIGPVKES